MKHEDYWKAVAQDVERERLLRWKAFAKLNTVSIREQIGRRKKKRASRVPR